MEEEKIIKIKENKGFRIVVTDLDNNNILIDSVTDCIVGAVHDFSKDTDTQAALEGFGLTKCSLPIITSAIESLQKIEEKLAIQTLQDLLKKLEKDDERK